jgi:hypothetical protein
MIAQLSPEFIRVSRKPRLAFGAEFRAIFHYSDFVPVSVVDRKVSKFGQSGLVFFRALEKKYSTKTLTHKCTAFPRARSTARTARTTTCPRRERVHVFPSRLCLHVRELPHGAAGRLSSVGSRQAGPDAILVRHS